jgi:hypothetical protein
MPFFARPDLSDEQFKQLTGSTLTLSGTTDFTGVLKSKGIEIDATSGGTTAAGDALVFDGTKIKLTPISGGSGSGFYYGASPTTCTVGGLPAGTSISGTSIQNILQSILVPELFGTLTAPSPSFLMPVTNPYEVGCVLNSLSATLSFNRGCINPQYCSASDKRSGAATCYTWNDFYFSGHSCVTSSSSISVSPFPSYTVAAGNRSAFACVTYAAGVQPLGSEGTAYNTPLSSGVTAPQVVSVCGIYPYFFGKIASGGCPAGVNRPTDTTICSCIIAADLSRNSNVNSGPVINVGFSNSTININFCSTPDDYIWFAIPVASTPKTCWYVDATNKGSIGGAVSPGGNLFPAASNITDITTICWSGQTYQAYISNYQTCSTAVMQLRNI